MSRKIYIIIAMVFMVVLSVSTFFIIRNHIDSAKQNEVYDNLAEIVEDEPPKENEGVTFSEDKDYLAEYLELYRQNEDMVGWIKVEDTNINYPVVQSVNEPNFYLKHKFDKTYSAYGCPYVQENCDVQKPSDNIIIYGHHMNDGSMFTGLMKYRNKSFWEGHKTITFDTLTDRHRYEVIAVFKTVVYTDSSDSFKALPTLWWIVLNQSSFYCSQSVLKRRPVVFDNAFTPMCHVVKICFRGFDFSSR